MESPNEGKKLPSEGARFGPARNFPSQKAGSDTCPGGDAGSLAHAFRTIQKAATLATSDVAE